MEILIILMILFYMLSTAAYLAYLFLQKNYLQRIGYLILLAGFICHTIFIISSVVKSGHIPAGNLHQTLSLAGWVVAGLFLIIQITLKLKILGIFAAPLVTLVMIVVSQLPNEPAQITKIFKNFWLISHLAAVFIGEASFALACGLGILYLIQENAIKAKKHRFFFRRLPSLESAGLCRIRLHCDWIYHAHIGAHYRFRLCQIYLGPILELGPERGLVRNHLAVLCRLAS